MKLKAKLLSTIAAFCMVICLLSVGIWAASKGTVSINGSVSFDATDIEATIDASLTGQDFTTQNMTQVVWNRATVLGEENTDAGDENALYAEWNLSTIKFVKQSDGSLGALTLTVTVTNTNTERNLVVNLTKTATDTEEVEFALDKETATIAPAGKGVENSAQFKLTITPKVTASESVALTAFDLDVVLTNGSVYTAG